MKIVLGSKLSESNIDALVGKILKEVEQAKRTRLSIIFDCSDVRWMAHQELLVFTALLAVIADLGLPLKVVFLKPGATRTIDKRKAKQIVQIWEAWKIHNILPEFGDEQVFDIDDRYVAFLKRKFSLNAPNQTLYNRYCITPFTALSPTRSYGEQKIKEILAAVNTVDRSLMKILRINNCALLFENKVLNGVITKELYQHFQDQGTESYFGAPHHKCFFGVSLRPRLLGKSDAETQRILTKNFQEEVHPELRSFYLDREKGEFRNEALLQFTYVDFGSGIASAFKDEYLNARSVICPEDHCGRPLDTCVLEFAFRHPASEDALKRDDLPAGLSCLLAIAKRFNGLLVARSNNGSVFFNFVDNASYEEAAGYFRNESTFFPGTLISLYIPERTAYKSSQKLLKNSELPDLQDRNTSGKPDQRSLHAAVTENNYSKSVEELLQKCLIQRAGSYFLCSGNYYQEKIFQVSDVLNDDDDCSFLCTSLFDKLSEKMPHIDQCLFLSISSNGHKMLKKLIEIGRIKTEATYLFDNYYTFTREDQFEKLPQRKNFVLLCDVISTGFLVNVVQNKLKKRKSELTAVGVVVNSLTKDPSSRRIDKKLIQSGLIYLHKPDIPKIFPQEMWEKMKNERIGIVRTNPYTNSIISEDRPTENDNAIIIDDNEEFLGLINKDCLKVGFFKFNTNIHSYFFDMDKLLSDAEVAQGLLKRIFRDKKFPDTRDIDVLFYPQTSAIKYISPDFIRAELLNNPNLKIYELERLSTPEGWIFLPSHERIVEYCKGKKALILDDGSSSGGSIIQIIDTLAAMDVSEILLLSIIGRINSYKRDFFTGIKTININGNPIKLNIVFGSHWHIPTFFIDNSPLRDEKEWLKEVGSLPNLPMKIKKITEHVLIELEAKEVVQGGSAFIKNTIPVDELILVRERVGKISSYTFHARDFDFFQRIINDYYCSDARTEKYRELELLCLVFIHEPPLLKKARFIIPDMLRVMQDFVSRIVLNQPGMLRHHSINRKNLCFEWSGHNLLHLFFLCFDPEQLVEILNAKKLNYVIKSFCKKEPEVNYLLYRMLRYFPINRKESAEKNMVGSFRKILGAVSDDFEEDNDKKNSYGNLKIFLSFIASLPHKPEEYNSAASQLSYYFRKVVNDQFHNEYIYNDKIIITNQLNVIENEIRKKRESGLVNDKRGNLPIDSYRILGPKVADSLQIIRRRWKNIADFINELLRFDASFPGFIIPINARGQNEFDMKKLRELMRDISYALYAVDFADIQRARELLDVLFKGYIMGDSGYSRLFRETTTRNVRREFENFLEIARERYENLMIEPEEENGNFTIPKRIRLDFPKIYLREIVFKEILDNLRHADLNKPVYISWKEETDLIRFTIKNSIERNDRKGRGGTGMGRLVRFNRFPVATTFKRNITDSSYIQHFTFKKI